MAAERPTFYDHLARNVDKTRARLERTAAIVSESLNAINRSRKIPLKEAFTELFYANKGFAEDLDLRAKAFEQAVEKTVIAEEAEELSLDVIGGPRDRPNRIKGRLSDGREIDIISGPPHAYVVGAIDIFSPQGKVGDEGDFKKVTEVRDRYIAILRERNDWNKVHPTVDPASIT